MYVHQALLVVLRLGTGTAGYLSTVVRPIFCTICVIKVKPVTSKNKEKKNILMQLQMSGLVLQRF